MRRRKLRRVCVRKVQIRPKRQNRERPHENPPPGETEQKMSVEIEKPHSCEVFLRGV
jgi:hypothetical protein